MSVTKKSPSARVAWAAVLVGLLSLGTVPGVARTIHFDDFEDGRAPRTDTGFAWLGSGRNVYTGTDPVTGARPTPLSGRTALAFAHRAKPSGRDSTAQQMFRLGDAYPDLWIRYYVRIPDNFQHRAERTGSNNKWLCVWNDKYASASTGVTVCWNYLPAANGSGGSDIVYSYGYPGDGTRPVHTSFLDRTPFITPALRGKWIEVIHHVQMPSRRNAKDAVIQMWMRVPGRDRYIAVHDQRALPFHWGTGPRGFTNGYLMGWSNSGFAADTTFNIDDIQFSDTRPSALR